MFKKEYLKLYFICGTQDCRNKDYLETVELAIKSGVTMFQFREKGKYSKIGIEKLELAKKIKNICQKNNIPFIINDDVNLAIEVDADGVHIGQDDISISEARKLFPNKIIGLSIGSLEEYNNSEIIKADYIGVGPIYETISKSDAGKSCGLNLIKEIRNINKYIPIVAIGGITYDKVSDIIKSGANGVSVISAISIANNIKEAVNSFLLHLKL